MRILLSKDPIMKNLVEKFGELTLNAREDHFVALVSSIVGQQLSGKAADTIWNRVVTLLNGDVTPTKFLVIEEEALRKAGL